MAILTRKQVDSSHWYDRQGEPMHSVEKKNGDGFRPTNINDARERGLFPSVTNVLGIFAKPGLDKWRIKQVVLAALALKPRRRESLESQVARSIEEAFAQVDRASDWGTACHAAIESFLRDGTPFPPDKIVSLNPVVEFMQKGKLRIEESELRVVNETVGFAGTLDLAFSYGKAGYGILDFKTRKTIEGKEVKSYDFQAMQIAAYGVTYWSKRLGLPEAEVAAKMLGGNVYISSTEPGRIDIAKYPGEMLVLEWHAFVLACGIWRYLNDYDPRLVGSHIGRVEESVTNIGPVQEPEINEDVVVINEAPPLKPRSAKPSKPDTSDVDVVFKEGDNKRKEAAKPAKSAKASKPPKPKGPTLGFGKFKDVPIADLPSSYIEGYLLKQPKYADDKKLVAKIKRARKDLAK